MNKILDLVVGIFSLFQVVSKLISCPTCEDKFLWIAIPGIVYLLIWTVFMVASFYNFYQGNWGTKTNG